MSCLSSNIVMQVPKTLANVKDHVAVEMAGSILVEVAQFSGLLWFYIERH